MAVTHRTRVLCAVAMNKAPQCLFLRGLWIYESSPIQGRWHVCGSRMGRAVKVPRGYGMREKMAGDVQSGCGARGKFPSLLERGR